MLVRLVLTTAFLVSSLVSPSVAETNTCDLANTLSETARTVSDPELITASLWWAKTQYDPFNGKLIHSWHLDPETGRIDLIVNRQLWSILDYLKRYRFVNQMGTIARQKSYNLRVLNQQKRCLATYNCDFSSSLPECRIDFTPEDAEGFQLINTR